MRIEASYLRIIDYIAYRSSGLSSFRSLLYLTNGSIPQIQTILGLERSEIILYWLRILCSSHILWFQEMFGCLCSFLFTLQTFRTIIAGMCLMIAVYCYYTYWCLIVFYCYRAITLLGN